MPAFSIAVYQPKWFPKLPDLNLFKITTTEGKWVRPRDFLTEGHDATQPDPGLLKKYHDTLKGMYEERWDKKYQRLLALYEELALCCWCPYDHAAKRQLNDYGSFVCHSWPAGTFLSERGYRVFRDKDRAKMVK
jgi:hypothetical protein